MRNLLALIAGFVAINVTATAIAIGFRPVIAPMLGEYVRTDADGLAFGPLLGGYAVIALVVGWIIPRLQTGQAGWKHGAIAGTAIGTAVFLGDHMVTAGWSKIPATPMLLSGIADILAVAVCGMVIAAIRKEA